MNRLSHSSAMKFQDCPKAWEFHYTQKLRSKFQSAALLFGSAVDAAFEAMLKGEDAEAVFKKKWTFQEVNKKNSFLPDCVEIVYADSDFDKDLITLKQQEKLPNNWLERYKTIVEEKDKFGFKALPEDTKKEYNTILWHSLETKGLLMVKALREKIMPKINKVLSSQKKIELKNEEGDLIIGYADLVCEWKDRENQVIVFDLKTSTRNYEPESVITSPQLSLYVHALTEEYGTRKAGYIVLNKKVIKNKTKQCSTCSHIGTGSRARTCDNEILGKRCGADWVEAIDPEIFIQIIIDDIPEKTENIVLENMDYINQAINNGIFLRNLSSCIKPWGPCSYFNICYKDDFKDVIKLEE